MEREERSGGGEEIFIPRLLDFRVDESCGGASDSDRRQCTSFHFGGNRHS